MVRDLYTRCVRRIRFFLAPYWKGSRSALRKYVRQLLLPFRNNKGLLADLIRTPAKLVTMGCLAIPFIGLDGSAVPYAERLLAPNPVITRNVAKPTAAGARKAEVLRNEIVFIDMALQNPGLLARSSNPGSEVHFLEGDRSGLAQMTAILSGRKDVSAIHVLSHGDAGYVTLGTDVLCRDTVRHHAQALRALGQALAENGDLLIYGCNVAANAEGKALLADIAAMTDADVAGSVDLTSGDRHGGNWVLERRLGKIEARSMALRTYDGKLETIVVDILDDNESADGQVTLREALLAAETDASVDGSEQGNGADTIVFHPSLAGQSITFASNDDAPHPFGPTALVVTTDVTIEGDAAQGMTLDANNARRVFVVAGTGSLTLRNVTLSQGYAQGNRGGNGATRQRAGGGGGGSAGLGGGILNASGATLTLENCTVMNCKAIGGDGGSGGNYYNSGSGGGGGGGGLGGDGSPGQIPGGGNGGGPNSGAGGSGSDGGNATGAGGGGGGGAGPYYLGGYGLLGGGGGGGGGGANGGNGGFGGGGGGGGGHFGREGTGGFGAGDGGLTGPYYQYGGQGGAGGGGGAGLGGGIFNYGGTVSITNSDFLGNMAAGGSGGSGGGPLPSSKGSPGIGMGGGVFNNAGNVSIENTWIAYSDADEGGGLFGNGVSQTTIKSCTISENVARLDAAGIHVGAGGQLTVTNSTISGNSNTSGVGAGLSNLGTATLNNSTIAGNTGGADRGGTLNMTSCIVADNTVADLLGGGGTIHATKCLVETGYGLINGTNVDNVLGVDPLLGPLADNGGPTLTHALLPGSQALDAGADPESLTFDQRGSPRVFNGIIDIGAFEYGNNPPAATNLDQTWTYPPGTASVALDDIVVTDADAGEQITATLTLDDPGTGTLTATSGNGETYDPATGVWTIAGDIPSVNAALAAVEFHPAADNILNTTVSVDVRDGLESGVQPLTGTIELLAQNDPPVINSVSATPNPISVGEDGTFIADVTDVNGDVPTVTWTFGDGTTAVGATVTHAYGLTGTYTVEVTADDGNGGAATATLTVTVVAAGAVAGVGPDSDGDGYSDSLEGFAGSNPSSAADTPLGMGPLADAPLAFVKSLRVALNLRPQATGRDRIRLVGDLPIPDGFSFAGQEVVLDIGGVQLRFTLDAKGRGKAGNVHIRFGRPRLGFSKVRVARGFRGDYKGTLADTSFLDNANVDGDPRTVRVTILFNGQAHVSDVTMPYKAKQNVRGTAKAGGKSGLPDIE